MAINFLAGRGLRRLARGGLGGRIGRGAGVHGVIRTEGGDKLKRFLEKQKRLAGASDTVRVGFLEPFIANLALLLEKGDPKRKLPARPAYEEAIPAVKEIVSAAGVMYARAHIDGDRAKMKAIAKKAGEDALEAIRGSYMAYHGAELSERQKARKAGTPYQEKQLVGRYGPKLVARLRSELLD